MSSPPPSATHCQQCGALLDRSILEGICQSCLWSDLITSEDAENELPEIPGHEVFEEIGHGGMGIVYRARQLHPEREVALKIVAPYSLRAAEARQRFLMEVEAMAAVEHPAVLPLYEVGEDEASRPWLTMQLMSGGSLADSSGRYSGNWRRAAQLIKTLCHAVAFAHERGIIHRDLKPSNILFDSNDHPFIADFGLAKWAHSESGVTQSNYLLGSPSYLAPEAAARGSKATTTISDVYGLGAIFYELLTGAKPYKGESAANILTQIINQPPPSPRHLTSRLPRDLEVIVLKAMSRDPNKRYHSANAFADDLDRWLNGRPILARPVGLIEQILSWTRRNPALSIVSLLFGVSLITGGVLIWNANRELTVALDDAEARVDYMTRELPATVAPLGRLDLLDGVFENVAEHFEATPRDDPETLARHADFLTQWAQILRPRGRIIESVERLRSGYQKALQATSGNDQPTIEIVRSRVSAGLLLAEALIEEDGIPEARTVIADTLAFAASQKTQFSDDLRLKSLLAEIATEAVIIHLEMDEPQKALEANKSARQQWDEVKPLLANGPATSQNQISIISAIRYPYFEAKVFEKLRDPAAHMKALREYLNGAEALKNESPENLLYHEEVIGARTSFANGYLNTGLGNNDEIRNLLIEADQDAQRLAARDPGNIRWANNSVYTALVLARLSEKRKDAENYAHWQAQVGNRVLPLYQTFTTNLDFLKAKRDAGIFAVERRITRDWSWERPHYEGILQVQIEMARIKPDPKSILNVSRLLERFAWQIHENESTQNAVTWLGELAQSLQNKSHSSPETRAHWLWLTAFTHARIAGYQHNTSPGEESLNQSHAFLLQSLPGLPLLFNSSSASSDQKFRMVSTLLEAGASDASRQDNGSWIELVNVLAPLLPNDAQRKISKLISTLNFPSDVVSHPQFKSLKSLSQE